MDEVVIVIADLYLPAAHDAPAQEVTLPGFARVARYGRRLTLEHGWREWLARWVGREDLAQCTPASVAAASITDQDTLVPWLATPVHLAAGLTTLHFDARGILHLARDELERLAGDFQRTFPGTGATLIPLESGEFLLLQQSMPAVEATEPARMAGGHIAAALPRGAGAANLRRLGAEIEMWLHEHPVNRARHNRGELAISTLWIWGGGSGPTGSMRRTRTGLRAFGSDSYLRGLWRLCGSEAGSLPAQLDATFSYAPGAAMVVEAGRMVGRSAGWIVPEALAEVDRRFIAPAVEAVWHGELSRLCVLANDRLQVLSSKARRRFWRRPRTAFEGLR